MRKLKSVCLLFACGLLLLSGCGKKSEGEAEVKTEQAEEQAESGQAAEEEQQTPEARPEEEYPRDLTNEELREFTCWINKENNYGNYGFLLSEYTKPQDIDLNELFYSGAGMPMEALTPEEEKAYLKLTGQEEIYTSCTRLTTAQINEFLDERLGLSLDDMTHPLEWNYLPDFDIWAVEHGDTNYMNFTCLSGQKTSESTYVMECVPGDDTYTPYLPSCRLTLEEYNGGYRPVSNIYIEQLTYSKAIWKIEDQSFDVDLGGIWGTVTFTSYAPDKSAYGNKDVMFGLVKDGEEIYQFPAAAEDNYLYNEVFHQLLAVSFKDYDGDGDNDIIIIAEYQMAVHTEDGEFRPEVRIYKNRAEEGDFQLDSDRMDYLNLNGYNHTISEVMEHIGEAANPEAE